MNDMSRPTSPAMHQQPIPKPYAWRRDDVSESDWRVSVPERALARSRSAASLSGLRGIG